MKLLTSLISVALAIGAITAPAAIPSASAPRIPTGADAAMSVSAATGEAATTVLSFAPLANGVLVPGQDLVIAGTITNNTATIISPGSASIVLNSRAVSSRVELSSWLNPATTSARDQLGTEVLSAATPEIPVGRTVAMQFTVPAAAIVFGSNASYWGARTLAIRVASGGAEIGQVRSSIVWNPGSGLQHTKIALVMPLTTPQASDGLIPTNLLAVYTADGGLLARELDAVFDRPGIAIAIDPRILASIRILGDSAPLPAQLWLSRLESATNDTFALSYADSDLSVASQAKAPRLLAPTSFPINPSLFPNAPTPTPTPSDSSTPLPTPTRTDNHGTSGTPVKPLPDLASLQAFRYTVPAIAWPASGTVTDGDLDHFATGGLTTTILGSGNVNHGDTGFTTGSATLIGNHRVLVSDDPLSALFDAAVEAPTTTIWASAITALSSAIAVLSLEHPGDTRALLATLDRTHSGLDSRLAPTLAALATLPWAASSSLTETNAPLSDGSTVLPSAAMLTPKPQPAGRISTVAALFAAENTAGSFSSVLTDPTHITGERRLSLLALLSNSWTGDDAWTAATKKYLATSNRYLTRSVTIARSSATVFTSRNSPLPITVTNELLWPVTVYVSVRSPSNIITIDKDRVELVVEAQSQSKTTVPVTSNANGPVTLTVSLSSATNVQITTPTTIDVDVQAQWETAFTAVVAALVFGVFGFGIYRTIAKRRKRAR